SFYSYLYHTPRVLPSFPTRRSSDLWIDAAGALRMKDDAVIILDPVNMSVIKKAHAAGIKDYIGGNCTVSLMLMGMAGLFQRIRRSEEHTSELQSRGHLVCRLLLEKK